MKIHRRYWYQCMDIKIKVNFKCATATIGRMDE